MKYYFSTIIKKSFGQVVSGVTEELKNEGNGVLVVLSLNN